MTIRKPTLTTHKQFMYFYIVLPPPISDKMLQQKSFHNMYANEKRVAASLSVRFLQTSDRPEPKLEGWFPTTREP